MRRTAINHRLSILLSLLAFLSLAAVLAGELTDEPPELAAPPPAENAADSADELELPATTPPDIAASAEMVARPLFFASRQPLPAKRVAATSAPPPPPPPELTLLGTVISGEDKIAVVRMAKQPRPQQLLQGQAVDGWTVAEVADDYLVIGLGEATRMVMLPEIGRKQPMRAALPAAAATPLPVSSPSPPAASPATSRPEEIHPPAAKAAEPVARPDVPYVESRPARARGR